MDLKSLIGNKTMWAGIAVVLALIVGLYCKYVLKSPKAIPVEIAAEKLIDKETGIDFDFSCSDTNLFNNLSTKTGGADK
jgi:hypothetical protein